MFVIYNNKVYSKQKDSFVGVEIYPDKIIFTKEKVKEIPFDTIYTLDELKIKYHINEQVAETPIEEIKPTEDIENKKSKKPTKK